ncbi:MAG: V-type ATPase subunit [Oscillospiraceae bacterium]|nr:V-type ATPase subunit [Oscillospiraceae bacterium]MBR4692160.1 V-type ATPase subunit [Oscillospiraceae bacterium]
MKKIKDTDYLYLSSYLQAKKARRGEGNEDRSAVYRELLSLAPDPQIVDFFRLKYDYHNAKVYLKSVAMGSDNSRLYLPMGRVTPAALTEACRAEDYRDLPAAFAEALRQSADTLARTSDPRLADFLLDLAYARELKAVAEKTGSAFLRDYAVLNADALNLRALVRMLKSGVRPEQLKGVLTDCGSVSPAALGAAYPDAAAVLALFRPTKLAPALGEGEKAARGEGFAAFEKAVRRCLNDYMDGAKYACFGEKVLIRYLYQIEEQST